MGRPTKYNPIMRVNIIELYGRGYSLERVAQHLGITRKTLRTWVKNYELRPLMDEAREETAKECIEVGLRRLAAGAEELVEEESFTYNRRAKRLNDESGEIIEEEYIQPVEKTVKKKLIPPSVKAIEVLSRKYYKEFDSKAEERELTTKVLEGFTMRELQEARKDNPIDKGQYIDAEFKELSSDDS